MKKIVFSIVALVSMVAFAGVEAPFMQFSKTDYSTKLRPDQNWVQSTQLISLKVSAGTDVWLSNYINSWYWPKPIPGLDGNVYDMLSTPERYGYISKSDLPSLSLSKEDYADKIHWGTGEMTEITYYYDSDPSITNKTTGYFLGHFDADDEIYLVMTTLPSDGGETVDSYQYVQDDNHNTTLMSRQADDLDLAGNVRVNFGIDLPPTYDGVGIAREFVAVYAPASGGPLPSLLFTGLLSLSTVFGASKMKKQKRA